MERERQGESNKRIFGLWKSALTTSQSKNGQAQTYALAALVLILLLIAAIDRAAENCRLIIPKKDQPGSSPMGAPGPIPNRGSAARPILISPASIHTGKARIHASVESHADAWQYFHPTWDRDSPVSFDSLLPYPSPTNKPLNLIRLLDDPENRLEAEFRVPRAMRDRVLFWMQIHSRFDTAMRVIHDRNRPRLVYGYADFSVIYRSSASRAQADARAYRLEREIVSQLKARIAEAAGLTDTHLLSPWEKWEFQQILSRTGSQSQEGTRRLMNNVRSQTGQRDEFLAALKRSENILPYAEMTFRLDGLPAALCRIPFVESSFNWHAHSKVGAMGMWQFMPETARQMIGGDPSKWSDPLRQTRGAARLFRIFREMLPDWSTAVTSYNSGAGRLKHLVQKYHTRSIVKLLDVSDGESLGFAGKNFYAQFLSVNLMEAYKKEIFPELRQQEHEDLLAFHHVQPFSREFREVY